MPGPTLPADLSVSSTASLITPSQGAPDCNNTGPESSEAETPQDDLPYFSYSAPEDGPLKRGLIQIIERATGQPKLRDMYLENRRHPVPGESFWAAALRYLRLTIRTDLTALEAVPRTGPVVFVANHPYGVLDGIVLSYLVSTVREEFKVLTNSVLYRAPEIRPYILPIDFAETREATRTNVTSRAEARRILREGGTVVAFPGGTVSTSRGWFGRAADPDWKPFTARLIMESEASVVPVFFGGQNSRLFQIASHVSATLRLSLLFKEVADRIGSEIPVTIGAPIPYADLQHIAQRKALADDLRSRTYALGGIVPPPPV